MRYRVLWARPMVVCFVGGLVGFAGSSPAWGASAPDQAMDEPFDPTAEPLKIAFISYANPQQVIEDIKPVVAYLQRRLGAPVKGFVTLDYGSSVESMRNGHTDVAFVDPLAFMMAHEQIGAIPLLLEVYQEGTPTYHSNVWVRRDSGLHSVEDLAGKTMAFADPVDMSGYLLPRDIFERKSLIEGVERPDGGFFSRVYFAGGDEQAMRAVLNSPAARACRRGVRWSAVRKAARSSKMASMRAEEPPGSYSSKSAS